ncbi:MAG: AMP-binding protein [Magnetococcales bacterium]|nr:AMP-binding protein [Magnetococcales bacterium]
MMRCCCTILRAPQPAPRREISMWHDFIGEFAKKKPHHPAIIDKIANTTHTYHAMESLIQRWGNLLHARGIGQGDRVVWLAPACMEHILLFFACARVGAILVPLNHRLPPSELAGILDLVEPQLFLGSIPPPPGQRFPYLPLDAVDITADRPTAPAHSVADDDPMLMLFTSGSTGMPKGVLFHAAMIMANIRNTVDADVLEADDISIVNTPFFHTGAYHVFLLPLLSMGGTLLLFDRFDPGGVLQAIRDEGITIFWAVPTMFQAIYDHPDFAATDFSRIRCLLSGGAPLNVALMKGYHARGVPFKQGFGLTEVGPNCFLLDTEECWHRPDSIGKPMRHSQVLVVDDANQPVPPDQPGELLIGGPHLCRGYWRNEELFRNSLHEGCFRTGDLVRYDREGFFFVVGRKKEMYISGGENVYPGEVEKQILTHPEITQAVVVAVPDAKWTEVGYLFCVASREISLDELRLHLDQRLVRFKHPHHLRRLESLPLLANGKINRVDLQEMARRSVSGTGVDN